MTKTEKESTLGYIRPSLVDTLVMSIETKYEVDVVTEMLPKQTMYRVFIRGNVGVNKCAVIRAYFAGFRDASNL